MFSRHDQAPYFGPGLPVYPALSQVARVFGAPLTGNVYQAWLQQWNNGLILRDRTQVYVWEPNQIVLTPGFYDARLVGSYLELPLLVTWCCPGVFRSSSLSSQALRTCSRCPVSPTNWSVTFVGCTGGLTALNGTWLLTPDGDCSWAASSASVNIGLSIVEPGPEWALLAVVPATAGDAYYLLPFNVSQCLGPLTLTLSTVQNGTAPGTLILTGA
jgi:hypothetical protein